MQETEIKTNIYNEQIQVTDNNVEVDKNKLLTLINSNPNLTNPNNPQFIGKKEDILNNKIDIKIEDLNLSLNINNKTKNNETNIELNNNIVDNKKSEIKKKTFNKHKSITKPYKLQGNNYKDDNSFNDNDVVINTLEEEQLKSIFTFIRGKLTVNSEIFYTQIDNYFKQHNTFINCKSPYSDMSLINYCILYDQSSIINNLLEKYSVENFSLVVDQIFINSLVNTSPATMEQALLFLKQKTPNDELTNVIDKMITILPKNFYRTDTISTFIHWLDRQETNFTQKINLITQIFKENNKPFINVFSDQSSNKDIMKQFVKDNPIIIDNYSNKYELLKVLNTDIEKMNTTNIKSSMIKNNDSMQHIDKKLEPVITIKKRKLNS